MYAIVEVGARQYKVQKDDIIEVEKQAVAEDKDIALDKVLMVCDGDEVKVGQPYLKAAKVKAEVLAQFKADKVVSFKYRRRKGYHRKVGHRQQLTRLKIKEIIAG